MNEEERTVRVAVAGVGNCASCLVQGAEYLRDEGPEAFEDVHDGLLTPEVCGYGRGSVQVVLGFDVDERKVHRDLSEAIWAEPNCAAEFYRPKGPLGPVLPGPLGDGIGESQREKVDLEQGVRRGPNGLDQDYVTAELEGHGIDVLVNFLPVGSESDSRLYAQAALNAGVAFVNAIPVWIARDPELSAAFRDAAVPLIGDDVKSQVGATILHRAIAEAFESRGAKIEKTYQLNFGGNTDFYNMKDEERLATKRESKTSAVTSVADVDPEKIHIGPSGFVDFLQDEKIAFIRVEGQGFCANELKVEVRYSGQDSPNSAAVVYDAVRFAAAAGRIPEGIPRETMTDPVSAWLMKAPSVPESDSEARERCAYFARSTPEQWELPDPSVAPEEVLEEEGSGV